MTCKNCVDHDKCKAECETNEYRLKKMQHIEFWDNAERSCNRFKKREETEVKDNAGCKVDQDYHGYV